MKKFLLALVLTTVSLSAFAQMVFPRVWNNRSSVSLDAWNSTDRNVTCWGQIYLDLNDNRRESLSVHEFLWPRGSIYRTYYPHTMGATIEYVSHSVFCN
jgi:hypothetical protein